MNSFGQFITDNINVDTDLELFSAILELESSIEYTLSDEDNLSNGDTVIVSVSWDEEVAEKYGFKFTGKDLSFDVSDLTVCEEIDLFQDIEVNFSGVSPSVSANVINKSNNDFLKNVNYSIDKSSALEMGDTIVVSASYSDLIAETYGYYSEIKEKEYVVEDTDYYLTSYSEINDVTMKKLKSQSEDLVEAYFANESNYLSIIHNITGKFGLFIDMSGQHIEYKLKNSYFFVNKDFRNVLYGEVYNSLFMIYEVTISDDNYIDGSATYYVPIYYKDFIMRNTGDVDVVITDAVISNSKNANWDNVYRDVVTSNKDKYTFEEITY